MENEIKTSSIESNNFAFEDFNALIDSKDIDVIDLHRAWLLSYENCFYSIAEDGKHKIKWSTKKRYYSNSLFDSNINMISGKSDRLVIEFDDKTLSGEKDKIRINKNIEKVKKTLIDNGWGFIESSHNGSSNYLWIEFTRDLSYIEKKQFLKLIAPNKSEIDLNFCSSKKVFPVLFAPHWKYGTRELPIDYKIGKKIDFDSLNIPKNKKLKKKTINQNGFKYETAKAIEFSFEVSGENNIKTLEEVEKIIKKNFPSIWFETKACLSACATLCLKNLNGCPSLNLVGNPSGEKTTVLSFFYGHKNTYISDDFTPRSFVSHSTNVKFEELENIDLLPRIKNKILITPELAPLFESPKDKLIDNFATLTRVLDGEGLNRDSGTHGHRGYCGDYKFIWLGATTPLRASVWNIMGKIGNRLFFLNMREKNRNDLDYLDMFKGRAYEEKVKECRGVIRSFLDNHFELNKVRSVEWDAENDIFILQEIIKYAQFLSKLRTSLMLWKSEGGNDYEFNFPVTEEPPRAINSLYNLAKGHALINGRNFLKSEDLEIVKAVCFSTMPHDRSEFLKLLSKYEGKLTTSQIQTELNCSDETARKTMKIFEIIGIVTIKSIHVDYSGTGRPMNYIEIKPEFLELLQHAQGTDRLENTFPSNSYGVRDEYSTIKPEDFIKK